MNTDLPRIARRERGAHKGDYGHVLVAAGSVGMTGAAVLTTEASLRSGAGLVTLACPAGTWTVLASHLTEALVKPVGPAGASGWSRAAARDVERIAAEIASEALVMAVGPGMGRSNEARECAVYLASAIRRPLVLDADGIVAFDDHLEVLAARDAPTILTPHPGEAARVVGAFDGRDDRERLEAATRLATSARAVVVLKGHRSIITDGETTAINETGNPGMATGGSGDVLTGLIAGLLACGMEPFDAARLGAHLHGAAGDLAAQEVGEISLVAEDIVRCLPSAIVRHRSGSH